MKEREKWIDAVRAIACIVVFVSHFVSAFCRKSVKLKNLLSIKPIGIITNGEYAVCLFLMISAYIICVSIYNDKNYEKIQKMAFKRYFRLMLPILFLSVFSFIISHTGGYHNGEVAVLIDNEWLTKHFYKEQMTISQLVQSVFIEVWWPGNNVFNSPFWMLHILFLGSYLAIILAVITSSDNKRGIAVLVFMLIVFGYLNNYYYCMVLGAVLAFVKCKTMLLQRGDSSKVFKFVNLVLFALAFYLPTCSNEIIRYFSKFEFLPVFFRNIIFYNGTGSFLLLFSIMNLNRIKNFLARNRLMHMISNISFAIYLVHWPIIGSFSCWFYLHFWNDSFDLKTFTLVLFLATVLVITVVSILFYELIEKRICTKITNNICDIYFKS